MNKEGFMSWSRTPPTAPGTYKVRRAYWGGRTATDTVLVYEDGGRLWVVEYSHSLAPDINQPMDEWLEQQPRTRWQGPLTRQEQKKEGVHV